jgi:predicted chitinase
MKAFYDSLRKSFGPLSANQVKGLDALLVASDGLPVRHRAYILATAWHETGPAASGLHMTPRKEIWGPTSAQHRYEGHKGLGNVQLGDGKRYMGRGYVQITGRDNYKKASTVVGRDLVSEPDLALEPDIAGNIIVDGMRRGWFTGKKMSDFGNYADMRKVVNGTDKATLIAGYADKFEAALRAVPADAPTVATQPPVVPVTPPTPEYVPPSSTPAQSLAAMILGAVAAAFAAFAYWMTKG